MINKLKNVLLVNKTVSQIILKNSSWVFVANILAKAFKLVLMIFIARELGPAFFGNANYIIVLSAMCFAFSDIGLTLLVNREYLEKNTNVQTLIASGWAIKIILVSINAGISLICLIFLDDAFKIPFFIFSVMNIIDKLKQYKIMLARANFKQEIESISFIIETSLTTVLGIALIWKFSTLTSLASAYLIGSSIAAIYIWQKTKPYAEPLLKFKKDVARTLAKKMIPFSLSVFLSMALISIDTLMIKWLIGSKGVGYYHSGNKIAETILIIPAIFGTTVYSFIAKFQDKYDRLATIVKKSINLMLLIGFPIFFGGILLAETILITVYSSEFLEGVTTFKLLIAAAFPLFLVHILNNTLLAIKKEKICVSISAIVFSINIILNLILIPKLGINGAATGTLLSRSLLVLLLIYFIKKTIVSTPLFHKRVIVYFSLSIIMTTIVFLSQKYLDNILILILIGIVSYFIGLISINDPYIKKIKQILKSEKK